MEGKGLEFNQVIMKRREITSFLEEKIPKEVMDEILNQACLSPTGNNLPSREFIAVTNRDTLDLLYHTTPYMRWLKEAQGAIVVTGRPEISKYWLQDASIACSYIWLSAVNEGLGCAFGAVFNMEDEVESEQREEYVRKTLHIPSDRRVIAVLGLGYQKDVPENKINIPKNELVHYESFSIGK
jgi:nitroreductase